MAVLFLQHESYTAPNLSNVSSHSDPLKLERITYSDYSQVILSRLYSDFGMKRQWYSNPNPHIINFRSDVHN